MSHILPSHQLLFATIVIITSMPRAVSSKLNSGQVTAALSFCKATFLASFRILEKNRKIMPPKSNNQKKKEAEAAGKAPKKTKQQENAGGLIP